MGGILQSILQLPTVHSHFRVAGKHSEMFKVVHSLRNVYQARTGSQALGQGRGQPTGPGPALPGLTLSVNTGAGERGSRQSREH